MGSWARWAKGVCVCVCVWGWGGEGYCWWMTLTHIMMEEVFEGRSKWECWELHVPAYFLVFFCSYDRREKKCEILCYVRQGFSEFFFCSLVCVDFIGCFAM
ncbi:hypothetical protein B0J12DRAFT_659215 [Macrophomina phaseolina]|uniref:Secreted protein n=1 Tax=Macrophomina phaseolina TaxID=35725 RepID=A0ABQ8GGU2_9PEZI|nr:hypothetical protein B0J12DRAFT_659215 [Macrophomina phaseolina]